VTVPPPHLDLRLSVRLEALPRGDFCDVPRPTNACHVRARRARHPCGEPAWGHDGAFPGYFIQALVREGGDRQVVYAVNSDLAALPYLPGAERVQQAQRALERAALCDS
jgi:hypothetical protein